MTKTEAFILVADVTIIAVYYLVTLFRGFTDRRP